MTSTRAALLKPLYQRKEREIDDVEQPFVDYAISRGWLCEKVISQSRRGWPDRLLIRRSRVVFAEFKRDGETPTPQQIKRHADIRRQGGEVVWFDNLDKAKEFFK